MPYSQLEFERDPTLQKTRLYDKVNPELEGYETFTRTPTSQDDVDLANKVELETLAIANRKYAA